MDTDKQKTFPYRRWLVIVALFAFVSMGTALSIKYALGGYNGLDLAIYNQVAWHTVHGDWFGFTIHPHSYLGDHLELIFVLLIPVYAIVMSPLTLILTQLLLLVAAVWPLWLIAREKLTQRWSFVLCLAWLLSPFVQSMAIYEFHAMALAPFFILWTVYFYTRQRWWFFVSFFIISLAIREDIALTLIGFGLIALLEKRPLRWRLFPIIAGVIWFVIALKLSTVFTGYEQYKFLAYYGWLGDSPLAMIGTFINHPLYVLQSIATVRTITFVVGMGLPFLFLFLLRPKYLVLAILPLIQLVLLRNPGELSLVSHYIAPFLAPLFVALIEGLAWLHGKPKQRLARFFSNEPGLVQSVFIAATVGGLILMGPPVGYLKEVRAAVGNESRSLARDITSLVARDQSVAAGYYLLTDLSSRSRVYSLHYQFLGKKQFSEIDYRIPDDTDAAIVNADDALIYHVTYEETDEKNLSGDERLREFLDPTKRGCTDMVDRFLVYRRGVVNHCQSFETNAASPAGSTAVRVSEKISFLGWRGSDGTETLALKKSLVNGQEYRVVPITTYWRADQRLDRDYSFRLILRRGDATVYEKRYPFAYGLFVPTSWTVGTAVASTYHFLVPRDVGDPAGVSIALQVELLDGHLWLDGWRGVTPTYDKITPIGEPITIGTF